jgi:hypothetical protein
MNSTNAQRSFVHELSSQMMGHTPSNLWGVQIPHTLHPASDHGTLQYVQSAAKHPAHEFGRLISSHKKASGWISTLGDLIGDGAKVVGGYGKKVAGFISKNGKAIQRGVSITKDLVQTGSTIAQLTGLINPNTKSTIDKIAAAVAKHAQGAHYKTPTPAKGKKTGGYFERVLI